MSSGERIPFSRAQALMTYILDELSPYYRRAEPAGSIRRRKKDMADLDLVVVPYPVLDLFHIPTGDHTLNGVNWARIGAEVAQDGPKKKKVIFEGVPLELHIVTPPAQWGVIFALRTGPADFSNALVTPRNQLTHTGRRGLMPSCYHFKDGALWRGNTVIETPEEEDLFRALELEYISPEMRK